MPANNRFGSDHRFAIEDLLDQYLDAFKRDSRVAMVGEREEAKEGAVEVMPVPEEDDQRCAAGALRAAPK